MRFTHNGQSSPEVWETLEETTWPEEVKDFFKEAVANHLKGHPTAKLGGGNYAEPRPYRNEYDRGCKDHYLSVTIYADGVYQHLEVTGSDFQDLCKGVK
jgi:hypothetical protein